MWAETDYFWAQFIFIDQTLGFFRLTDCAYIFSHKPQNVGLTEVYHFTSNKVIQSS